MRLRCDLLTELVARTLAVAVPVFVILALEGSLDSGRGFVLGLVVSAVFLACIQAGFRANATDLLALGPFVAAVRGTIYALVILSALDLWLDRPDPGSGSLFLCAAAVLTLVTLTQSLLARYASAKRRVLIVGRSGGAPELIEELRLLARHPFEVIGVIDENGAQGWPADVAMLGSMADLWTSSRPSAPTWSSSRSGRTARPSSAISSTARARASECWRSRSSPSTRSAACRFAISVVPGS